MKQEKGLAQNEVTQYSVGPFTVDTVAKTVTMASGEYTICKPLILFLHERTVFEDICYQPLHDGNAYLTVSEGTTAEHVVSGDICVIGGGFKQKS